MCAVETALAHQDTFPSRGEAYGPTLRRLIETGLAVDGRTLAAITMERERFKGRLARLFREIDLLLIPAMYAANPTHERMSRLEAPEEVELLLRFTAPYDMTGSPTITLPCGFTPEGLPVGFQLVGRHLAEDVLLRAGHAYQQATDWHTRHPAL
jgi:amidase